MNRVWHVIITAVLREGVKDGHRIGRRFSEMERWVIGAVIGLLMSAAPALACPCCNIHNYRFCLETAHENGNVPGPRAPAPEKNVGNQVR